VKQVPHLVVPRVAVCQDRSIAVVYSLERTQKAAIASKFNRAQSLEKEHGDGERSF